MDQRLAEIETCDNGKLLREMRAQLACLPEYYRYFAGMADKIQGEVCDAPRRRRWRPGQLKVLRS